VLTITASRKTSLTRNPAERQPSRARPADATPVTHGPLALPLARACMACPPRASVRMFSSPGRRTGIQQPRPPSCGSRPGRQTTVPTPVAASRPSAMLRGRTPGSIRPGWRRARPCHSPATSGRCRSLTGVTPAQSVDDGTVRPVVAAARLDEMGEFVVQRLQLTLLGRDLLESPCRDPLDVGA